jgi:ribonuclease P protein component
MAPEQRDRTTDRGAEGFPPGRRVRRRGEFREIYDAGRRNRGRLAVVFAAPGAGDGPRLGITVTKKVGGAVVRNRLRRQVREIFRRLPAARTAAPERLVVNLSPGAARASFAELREELERLLARALGPTP